MAWCSVIAHGQLTMVLHIGSMKTRGRSAAKASRIQDLGTGERVHVPGA